eukprot:TRINITY_DN16931_c0_g1_i1.p1 TRINITY_DN16931_c0_g1~~TRINITY_DN16931_c0_g1_i1.p1  ORF type:complete len:173 (-),score=32.41 TRINITY_DN16931_c0_g1_i1:57-575(-)
MAVLCRDEILKALRNKEIVITPEVDQKFIGPASMDLSLGNEFRYFQTGPAVVPVQEDTDYKDITEKVFIEDGHCFVLLPGQSCLGITRETVKLSPRICGLLEGRSRFARLGLFVHITASFINPGIENQQVLEIYNSSNHALELYPGTKICQFVFMPTKGEATYTGQYRDNQL